MDFRILGALEVEHEGRLLPLDGAKQRGLLALLLLHANQAVSHDALIDQLWGTGPPQSAEHCVEVHVSRLRRLLLASSAPLLETRPAGYVLHVDPEQFDLDRFEMLLKAGREALKTDRPESAAETLRKALSEWRGDALADLTEEQFAATYAGWLEESRLSAVEGLMEAELRSGRHSEILGELQQFVAANPLCEHLRCQLMLALYRAGRQADALALYREGRERLVENLGIEPCDELRHLEQAILHHDPALASPGADHS
jgi:DNA-binding SARP family transcriptional activator